MTSWNCIFTFLYFNFGLLELNPGELYQNLAKVLSQKNTEIYSFKLKAGKTLFFIPHTPLKGNYFCIILCKKYFYKASSNNGVLWHAASIQRDLKVWSRHSYKPYFKRVGSCRFITRIYLYGLKHGPLLQDSTQGLIHLWWEIFSFQPALNQSNSLDRCVLYSSNTFLTKCYYLNRRIYQR